MASEAAAAVKQVKRPARAGPARNRKKVKAHKNQTPAHAEPASAGPLFIYFSQILAPRAGDLWQLSESTGRNRTRVRRTALYII